MLYSKEGLPASIFTTEPNLMDLVLRSADKAAFHKNLQKVYGVTAIDGMLTEPDRLPKNVALHAKVKPSSVHEDQAAAYAADGDPKTGWASDGEGKNARMRISLGKPRYWITHRTRWIDSAESKYSGCAIRNLRYKLVMPEANVHELYDLDTDIHEKNDIADQHPEIVKSPKQTYDAWWEDIQPYLVNDHLTDIPETLRPYHEPYRRDFGQQRDEEAVRRRPRFGGKPDGAPRTNRRSRRQ